MTAVLSTSVAYFDPRPVTTAAGISKALGETALVHIIPARQHCPCKKHVYPLLMRLAPTRTPQGMKTGRASNDDDDDDDDDDDGNLDGFASKREKRLAANRVAAKCSRQKKKEFVDD